MMALHVAGHGLHVGSTEFAGVGIQQDLSLQVLAFNNFKPCSLSCVCTGRLEALVLKWSEVNICNPNYFNAEQVGTS